MNKKKVKGFAGQSSVIGLLVIIAISIGVLGYLTLEISNDHTIIKQPSTLTGVTGSDYNASSLLNNTSGVYGLSSSDAFVLMLFVVPIGLVGGYIGLAYLRGFTP